jgi:ACR3 family arsenite transporter
MERKERKLGILEKYLSIWVLLCILAGTGVGRSFPQISDILARLEVAHVSVPIAICLFAIRYPIMVQISFG